jgi:hypothetical protein
MQFSAYHRTYFKACPIDAWGSIYGKLDSQIAHSATEDNQLAASSFSKSHESLEAADEASACEVALATLAAKLAAKVAGVPSPLEISIEACDAVMQSSLLDSLLPTRISRYPNVKQAIKEYLPLVEEVAMCFSPMR